MERLPIVHGLIRHTDRLLVPLAQQGWGRGAYALRSVSSSLRNMTVGARPSALDAWLAVLLVTGVLGFLAIGVGFLKGHDKVFGVEQEVPWGVLISTYVFFVVSSTGVCLVSSLGHVFGLRRFEGLGRQAVFIAIIMMVSGFIAIGAELENPWRLFIYMVVTPNFSSAIWGMGVLYSLELVFLVVEFILLSRGEMARRSKETSGPAGLFYRTLALGDATRSEVQQRSLRLAKYAGIGAAISGVAATSTLGAVFGVMGARPLWYGPFMPLYFLLTALVSGAAVLALVTFLGYKTSQRRRNEGTQASVKDLGNLLLGLLGLFALFSVWSVVVRSYGHIPAGYDALMLLVRGPLSLPFWGLEVAVGMLVPLGILLTPRARTLGGTALAALLVMVGMFAARYDLVVAGQLIPVTGQLTPLHYTPSYTEWLIVSGVFATCGFLYTLGHRVLPLGHGD
ncbi:MAG: polysulfide reductase NrfD [Chloroflexi bacterium]|nr:polysulfide reductase NrfD [Chloroflexota bacterium]